MSKFSETNKNTDVVEDFLQVDTPIPGQNFACISFISPEKVLKSKDIFMFSNFIKSLSCKITYPEDIPEEQKAKLPLTKLSELISLGDASYSQVKEAFDCFIMNEGEKYEKQFYEDNEFTTTVRGIKVRGVYDTQKEASVRAKVLQRKDKNFHVFVGQVGYWLPWDPCADSLENQEYGDSELNEIMKKYNENKELRDAHYDEDKLNKLEDAKKQTREHKKKLEDEAKNELSDEANLVSNQMTNNSVDTDLNDINSSVPHKKINELRNILKEKESAYKNTMAQNEVDHTSMMTDNDPWMQRKLDDIDKLNTDRPDSASTATSETSSLASADSSNTSKLQNKVKVLEIGDHKELIKDII